MPRRRRAAALAALLAALAAVAPGAGCKPSSLTPFGIGTRGPEDVGVNGLWQGVTTLGGTVEFSVAAGVVTGLSLTVPGCWRLTSGDFTANVEGDDTFSLEVEYAPAGRLVVDGRFTSTETAAGSYFYEGFPLQPPCPTAGSAGFVAGKVN